MNRRDLACAAGAAAAALLVYVRTLAPGVVAEVDTPMFQFIGRVLGVAHNPGYPLYVLVTHPFSYVPIGSLAYRINLFSALMGAAAVGLTWLAARALGCRRATSVVAALGLAYGPVFWSQAVIAEVYTMHAAIVAASLVGFLEWGRTGRRAWFYAGVAALAAGLAHHTTIVAFIVAAAVHALLTDRAFVLRARTLATTACILLCGLLPYLFVVIRSNHPGAYLESSAPSLASLPGVILARQFQDRVFAFDAGAVFTERLPSLVEGVFARELTLAGLGLAALGVFALGWRARRIEGGGAQARPTGGTGNWFRPTGAAALCLLLVGAAGIVGFALNYAVVDTPVFLIPALLAAWLLAAVGADVLVGVAAARGRVAASAAASVALLLPVWQFAHNVAAADRSRDTATAVVLDGLFAALPERAALVHEDFLVDRLIMFKRLTGDGAKDVELIGRDPVAAARRLDRGQPVLTFARSGRRLRLGGLAPAFGQLTLPPARLDELIGAFEDGSIVAIAAPVAVAAQFAAARGVSLAGIGGPPAIARAGGASLAVVGVLGARAGALVRADAAGVDIDVPAATEIGATGARPLNGFSVHAGHAEGAIRQGGRDLIRTTQGAALAVWSPDGRLAHTLVLQAIDGFRAAPPAGSLSVFPVRVPADVLVEGLDWAEVGDTVASGGVVVGVPPGRVAILYLAADGPLWPRAVDRSGQTGVTITPYEQRDDPDRLRQVEVDRVPDLMARAGALYRVEIRSLGREPASAVLATGGVATAAIARSQAGAGPITLTPVDYTGLLRTPDRVTELLQMSRDEQSQLVGAGWSGVHADAGGGYRWMTAPEASVVLPVARATTRLVRVQAFRRADGEPVSLSVRVERTALSAQTLEPGWRTYEWAVPAGLVPAGTVGMTLVADPLGSSRLVAIGDVRLMSP